MNERHSMKLRSRDLIPALAHISGKSLDEVTLKSRRLREAELFARETKGFNSPTPSVADIARLIFVMASDRPAILAKETVSIAECMIVGSKLQDYLKEYEGSTRKIPEKYSLFKGHHNFLSALELIVEIAIEEPAEFSPNGFLRNTFVSFNRQSFDGHIQFFEKDPLPILKKDPLPDLCISADYNCIYGNISFSAPKDWKDTVEIGSGFFCELGKLFHRGNHV